MEKTMAIIIFALVATSSTVQRYAYMNTMTDAMDETEYISDKSDAEVIDPRHIIVDNAEIFSRCQVIEHIPSLINSKQ